MVSVVRKFSLLRDPLLYAWLIGVGVRFFYFLMTARAERAHDPAGHDEYVLYVLTHFTIPPADGGWQLYHPPLYYFLVAIVLLPFKWCGFDDRLLLDVAQFVSFLISCGALAVGVWIARMLWSDSKDRFSRVAFCLTLAVLPGLVYSASRVSNDTLMQLLSFLFVGCLLKWSQAGALRPWYQAMVLLGLALITKGNALCLGAIAAFGLLLHRLPVGLNEKRLRIALKSAGVVCALSLWYFVYRFGFDAQMHLVGNIEWNGPQLYTTLSVDNFTRVNPFSVLRFPYNSPWTDEFGRNRIWEHLPKSAFTGEWNFGDRVNVAMRVVHFLNYFIFFPLAILALLRDVVSRQRVVLWASLVVPLVAMIGLMILRPIGGFQDFRYVNVIAIPVTFYVLRGIQSLPTKLRIAGKLLFCIFIALCVYCIWALTGLKF
jgi:hypothetical protein